MQDDKTIAETRWPRGTFKFQETSGDIHLCLLELTDKSCEANSSCA